MKSRRSALQNSLEDTTVEEAIDFLRLRASELDTTELDPARKGINFAVTLVPATESGEDLFTRTFRVPPDFASSLSSGQGEDYGVPFAEPTERLPRKPILELMKSAGINFPEGSSATLSGNGTLIITNTPGELDKVAQPASRAMA